MADAGDDHTELANLVRDIVDASKLPAKRRGTSIKPSVEKLASLAYEHGVLPEPLTELIDLLTSPSHLDQASLNSIVRSLYPASQVSSDDVLRVVGCLGHGQLKPSLSIQAALLRWLIMVYHVIDQPVILSQCYAVLFNLLDTAAIRTQLCHLLALVTRRKHVRPFRIQLILNLSRQTGKEPALIGLLRIYKDYYPEIIVGEAVRGKASAFKHPDPEWRARLDEIQEAHHQQADAAAGKLQDAFRVNRQVFGRLGAKLASKAPQVRTLHAKEDAVTLEEIHNVDDFVNNLEKLDVPSQLAAVLADPLLQKFVTLRPSDAIHQRISNWVEAGAQDLLRGDADNVTLTDFTSILHEYVVKTKHLPPLVLFLYARVFRIWNGREARDEIIDILSFVPIINFAELHKQVLQPFERCVLDNNPATQVQLLGLYTRILQQWTVRLKAQESIQTENTEAVNALIKHATNLAMTVLQTSPSTPGYSAILDFYEQTALIVSDTVLRQYIRIVIPPAQLVYILFFGHSIAVVARLCTILACYKRGFETAMTTRPSKEQGGPTVDSQTYLRTYVNAFNGFLMDICNCIWRGRAFNRTDVNALGCNMPPQILPELTSYVASLDTGLALTSLFGLSHSPTLCLQSATYLRELEEAEMEQDEGKIMARHPGPATQGSLTKNFASGGVELSWQQYRIGVLRALEDNGLVGIPELMKNTMKILMHGRESMTPKSSQN